MKKTITIIIAIVMLVSIMCGCKANPILLQEEPADVHPIIKRPHSVRLPEVQKISTRENKLNQPQKVMRPASIDPNAPKKMWHAKEMIEFTINGATYNIGDACGIIMSNFETVNVVDGHIDEKNMICSAEKVAIVLKDENENQFLVVIRNDYDKKVPVAKCTLHEILIESELFDMSNLTIQSNDGNMTLVEWVITLGENYGDYSYDDNTCYSWEIKESCYLDVCAIDNDVQYIQLMTY